MATTGTRVGFEGSDITLAFQEEIVWKNNPDGGAGSWTPVRGTVFTGDVGFETSVPNEIRGDRLRSSAVTTAITPSLSFTGPMTKLIHSPLMAALINSATNTGTMTNGTTDQTFTFIMRYGSSLMEIYTGCLPISMGLTFTRGATVDVNFDFLVGGFELSTAPTDPVDAFNIYPPFSPLESASSIQWKAASLDNVTTANLTLSREGAQQLYGIFQGTDAAGLGFGSLTGQLNAELYFNDFSYKQDLLSEIVSTLSLDVRDSNSEGYDFDFAAAKIIQHPNPVNGAEAFTASVVWQPEPAAASQFITITEV